jgi:nucleoside-diphosphate-sugar epimerase
VLALVRSKAEWNALDWTAPLRNVELVEGSLDDSQTWSPSLASVGGILHMAAPVRHSRRDPEPMRHAIVEGTRAMLQLAAARRCRMVVLSTSGTVGCSGRPEDRADEEAPYAEAEIARWPYYAAKVEMERMARAFASEHDVELVLLRPPILLGPGDHRLRSTSNVLRFLRGRMPFVVRGGMHFADVRDAARAILRVFERPSVRPIYHLEGTECSIEEFFAMLSSVSGVPSPRFVLPFGVASVLGRVLEPLHVVPEPVVIEMASRWWGVRSRYAKDELDHAPRDPRETLRETVEWLRANAPGPFARASR